MTILVAFVRTFVVFRARRNVTQTHVLKCSDLGRPFIVCGPRDVTDRKQENTQVRERREREEVHFQQTISPVVGMARAQDMCEDDGS